MSGFLSGGLFCCKFCLFAPYSCSCTVLAIVNYFFWVKESNSCKIWKMIYSLIEGALKTNSFVEISLMLSCLTCTSKSLSSMRWSLVGFDNTSGSFFVATGLIGCPYICSCSCAYFTACHLWVEACLLFKRGEQFVGPLFSLTRESIAISPLSCHAL